MKRMFAYAGILALALVLLTAAMPGTIPPGCAGQYRIDNNTSTYVVQAIVSGSPLGITLKSNGQQNSLDVPPHNPYPYLGQVSGNMWVSFFAWRGDTDDIALGAAELSSCDVGGDLLVTVTEKAGKPVMTYGPKPSGWFLWPKQLP